MTDTPTDGNAPGELTEEWAENDGFGGPADLERWPTRADAERYGRHGACCARGFVRRYVTAWEEA